jgi:hypothetical protein
MGAAVHNGEINLTDPARKALGSPVLFHPSAEVGYRWDGVNSLSIFADHMSNGFTQRYNEGMDTVGVRYGRRLGPIVSDTPATEVSIANFSGPYVGALAGYQYETTDWYTVSPVGAAQRSLSWGAYAGFNVQSGKGIFGLEVDGSPAKRNVSDGPGTWSPLRSCALGAACSGSHVKFSVLFTRFRSSHRSRSSRQILQQGLRGTPA